MAVPSAPRSAWLRRLPGLAICLPLAACISSPGPQGGGDGHCQDDRLGWAIGLPADEANLGRLWRESGAGLLNPIAPETVVRRDQRTDRLRVYLDADNRITAARCE